MSRCGLGYGIARESQSTAGPDRTSRPATIAAALALLAALSLGARIAYLFRRPLWHDEIFTAWAARQNLRALIGFLRADSGPPLFYLVERPFSAVAEMLAVSDRFLRIPSLVAALLTAVAGVVLARRNARGLFLLLAATSPLLFLYSAEARAYALLGLVDFMLFLLVRDGRPGPGRSVAIALVAAAALFTHSLAILFVASLSVAAAVSGRPRVLLPLGAGIALFLPWAPILAAQPVAALAWMREPPLGSVLGFLSALGGGGRVPAPFGAAIPASVFAMASAAGLALVLVLAGESRRDPELRLGVAAVALTLVGALAAALIRPVAFAGRTEMAVLPIWIWCVARAAADVPRLRLLAIVSAGAGAISIAVVASSPPREASAGELARALATAVGPGDTIIAGSTFYLPLRLASERGQISAGVQAFPLEIADHPGWFVAQPPAEADYRAVEAALGRVPPGGRLWLALHPAYQTRRLAQILEAGGTAREVLHGPDAGLTLWSRE